jgi:hypothetical protein
MPFTWRSMAYSAVQRQLGDSMSDHYWADTDKKMQDKGYALISRTINDSLVWMWVRLEVGRTAYRSESVAMNAAKDFLEGKRANV